MLNKPRGYVTTLSDEKGRRTVAELAAGCGARVWPVGRLDLDSEGLLLLTDDGALTHALLHPSHEVEKEYRVWVEGDVDAALPVLRGPMELDGYALRPAQVTPVGEGVLSVVIHEGRNRQVRRMCATAGLRVRRLQRVREGELCLGALPVGAWRHLTGEELCSRENDPCKEIRKTCRKGIAFRVNSRYDRTNQKHSVVSFPPRAAEMRVDRPQCPKISLSVIQTNMSTFSKGQKLIAGFILESYDKAAFMTASRLGKTVNVSESTVVRFAAELGYDGYPAMQKALQEMIRSKLTSIQRIEVSNDRIGNQDILSMVMQSDMDKIHMTLEETNREDFDRAVSCHCDARHIYILA